MFVLVTGYLIHAKILTWEDPIQSMLEGDADEETKPLTGGSSIASTKEVELVA